MGLTRFELVTPRLSSVCSNQLSYRPEPARPKLAGPFPRARLVLSKLDRRANQRETLEYQIDLSRTASRLAAAGSISRKEVIQPQVLLQLPCYDFTPITDHTLGTCLPCGLAQRLLVQPAFVM